MSETSENSKSSTKGAADKVTAVEKSEKVKDPRKVELGKKLAKISKEAKERKAKMWSESDREAGNEKTRFAKEINRIADLSGYVDFRYLVDGVTIVAALGGLYYAYKNDKIQIKMLEKTEQNKQSETSTKLQEENTQSEKVEIINKNDYDQPEVISTKSPCLENL